MPTIDDEAPLTIDSTCSRHAVRLDSEQHVQRATEPPDTRLQRAASPTLLAASPLTIWMSPSRKIRRDSPAAIHTEAPASDELSTETASAGVAGTASKHHGDAGQHAL